MKTRIALITTFCLFLFTISAQDEYNIVGNTSTCEFECVYLYVSPDPDPTQEFVYDWYIDGFNGTTLPVVTTTEPNVEFCDLWQGSYLVSLVMTGAQNVVYTDSIYIDVLWSDSYVELYSNASDFCPASDPSTNCEKVCQNTTVTYTATTSGNAGGNGILEWNVIGAESWTYSGSGIEVIWGEAGTGLVEVLYTDDWCWVTSSSSICVEILEQPEAAFETMPEATNGVLEICQGQNVIFENTSEGAVYFEWDLAEGDLASVASPEKTFNNPGSYEISLIAKNECFCADTTYLQVEVEATLSPFVDCVGTICGQESVTYTSDADCSDFFWTVSANGTVTDGGGINDDFISVDWGNGPYGMIELSVSNCNGSYCLKPAMIQIPIMTGNAQIVGPDLVCKGAAVTYSIQHYNSTYYNWSISSGQIINGQGSNTVSVIWNSPNNLPEMENISVDYENCYLECGGSDNLDVNIVDEFIILGDAEVCPEGIGEYQARSLQNGGIVSCNWSLSDELGVEVWSFNNASTVNVPYPATTGLYMIKATPVNPLDYCNEFYELVTHVAEKPDEVDDIEGELSICPGETYQYNAVSSSANNSFTWYINNGGVSIVREGNPVTITWASTGPYEISVTQTDYSVFPCESDPITRTPVAVGSVSLSAPVSACNEDVTVLTATHIDLGSYNWTITPSDMGSIVSEEDQSSIEILWHKPGVATVNVGICGVGDSKMIEIFPLPEPIATYPNRLCANETGTVGATAAFAEYVWNDENGNQIATGANPDLYSGSYELVVTDNNGCTGNTIFTIETLPIPNIRISTPDDTGICTADNEPYPLLYALNSEDGYTYEWFKDNVSVGNDNPLYQVSSLGIYSVVVTDFNGCQNTSNQINVFEFCGVCNGTANDGTCNFDPCISNTGTVNFTVATTSICNQLDFTSSSFGIQPGTESWYFDDPASGANNTSSDSDPSHTFSNAGFFTVILFGDVEDADNPGGYCRQYYAETVEIPMVAKFAYDKACPGENVNFIDLSSYLPGNTISSWSWDFGEPSSGAANTSSDRNPVHVYNDPGTYDVSLTITDGLCTSTLIQTIEVHPLPVVDILPPDVNCANTAIAFETTSANYVTEWIWDFGDPLSAEANTSEIRNTFHVFETPGIYTVTLTTTNVYGCSNSRSINVEIEPNLNNGDISSSVPIPICEGETVDLISPSGGVSWEWSTGETSETITVATEDVYTLTLTDQFGCTYEPDLFTVEVTPAPQTAIRVTELSEYGQILAIHYGNYSTCQGEDVVIEAIEYDNLNYVWSNNMVGNVLEFTEERGNQLPAGSYQYSVEITDTDTGCTNEIGPIDITIHANPQAVVIASNPSGYLCAGENTELSVSNPEAGVTYIWNNGETGEVINVEMAGEYFVQAINQYGCSTLSETIEVHAAPDLGLIPNGCLERCAPDTICLPTIPNIASYQWYFNDVLVPAPNGISPDFIAYESGTYHVVLTDIYGCQATSEGFYLNLIEPTGDLDGQVYYDVNNDGVLNAADTLVPDVQIYLSDAGNYIDSLITDANGEFLFDDIDSKEYDLVFDINSIEKASAYEPVINATLVGCDDEESVIFLLYFDCTNVVVNQSFDICPGSTVEYNGFNFGVDTSFVQVYQAIGGCDSTENVVINLLDAQENDITEKICYSSSLTIDNIELFPGDSHVFVYTNAVGCDSTINFSVEAFDDVEFDLDAQLSCPNESSGSIEVMNVTGGTAPYTYSIDGSVYTNDVMYTDLEPTDYLIYVKDSNGCIFENSIEVEAFAELSFDLDVPMLNCDDTEVQIDLEILSGESYDIEWSDGSTEDVFNAYTPGIYQVTLTNNCQSITQEFNVEAEDPTSNGIYIPNVFTPNGDNSNDRFVLGLKPSTNIELESFQVFDRWGNIVFESNDQQVEWDGKYNGKMLQPGIYVYQIKAMINYCHRENEAYYYKGDVTLIR